MFSFKSSNLPRWLLRGHTGHNLLHIRNRKLACFCVVPKSYMHQARVGLSPRLTTVFKLNFLETENQDPALPQEYTCCCTVLYCLYRQNLGRDLSHDCHGHPRTPLVFEKKTSLKNNIIWSDNPEAAVHTAGNWMY